MSDDPQGTQDDPAALPPPVVRRRSRWRVSAVWLVPLVAVLVGIGLVVQSALQRGPTIYITFNNAQWLTAGKTEVRYKSVPVGQVTALRLDNNFSHVIATVELRGNAARLARADTQFWVVRPRVDLQGVSGLRTLLSGAYIGVDIGKSMQRKTRFVGLEQPPPITNGQTGGRYRLQAADIGSLHVGAPVYYRHFNVGRVTGERLNASGEGVEVEIFVRAPYDKLIRDTTHFWNASGVNLSLGAAGFKLDTQSLISILVGGIAFGQRPGDMNHQTAPGGSTFKLYSSKTEAMAPPHGPGHVVRMRFKESVRGLAVGAQVDFRGIAFGHVTGMSVHYDPRRTTFYTDVDAIVYPKQLGSVGATLRKLDKANGVNTTRPVAELVKKGLRAQLRTANLISGQLYVALDIFPDAKPVDVDVNSTPVVIPTMRGSLEQIQEQIVKIVHKLNAMPLDRIGTELAATLASTRQLVQRLNTQLAPQAASTLTDVQKTLTATQATLAAAQNGLISPRSPLQQSTARTLAQVRAMAQSLQELANYLQRHPDALLRGRPTDRVPPVPGKDQ